MWYPKKVSRCRNWVAIVLSFAVFLAFPFIQSGRTALAQDRAGALDTPAGVPATQDRNQELSSASAMSTPDGVALQWHTSFELDTLGFNIYRVRNGQRQQANRSIIPGSVFLVGNGKPLPGGYSYQWFDREGTADSVYYIESEGLNGNRKTYQSLINVSRGELAGNQQSVEAISGSLTAQSAFLSQGLKEYPAELARPQSTLGQIDTQWTVAAQSALKIQINHDGWYRVTQQQMSAAGFNPIVDVKNLSVFGDGREIAIKTSKDSGQLSIGDYLEFYGRGLDTPDSDTRIYYLIAGTQPGKRSAADLQTDASRMPSVNQTAVAPGLKFGYRGWFAPLVNLATGQRESSIKEPRSHSVAPSTDANEVDGSVVSPNSPVSPSSVVPVRAEPLPNSQPSTSTNTQPVSAAPAAIAPAASAGTSRKTARSRRRNLRRHAKSMKPRHSHAVYETTATSLSFDYTVQLKERYANTATGFFPVYFTKAINGEAENWFGRVISSLPAIETIPIHNAASSADGPARLVVALQGIQSSNPSHQVNVFFNNVMIGTVSFNGIAHRAQTFNIPISQLQEGNNTVRLAQAASFDTSIVDYLTLTYPRTYQAFNDSLRFTLRSAQTLQVDGFSTPNVQLLDISDPTAVRVTQPVAGASALGYAITVPPAPRSKARTPRFGAPERQTPRTMYALLQGQFETPVGFSLNQPSSINSPSNSADLLILSYKDFIPSLGPLVTKRTNEGLIVKTVDIEDVYDEFSYGAHDHHAIKDLLLRATAVWTKAPRYVLLVGDASNDPRNYEAFPGGGGDFVPTNLVDTLFGEACSDDVLADFDGDGIAEIRVGRLPAGSIAEANVMVSKIANFSKANVPQTALFVADNAAETNYYFNFDTASDQLAALLPPGLTAQKIYRSQQSTSTARTNVINALNQGVALLNYSGHGNVNVWAGTYPDPLPNNPNHLQQFFENPDARGLNNGNRLSLVLVANCLNGLFNAPALEGLAEAFLKNPAGGGVAVYASSGETIPDGQQQMNVKLYQTLFGAQSMALGDVTKQAKTATSDMDVRRTWILLGDPSMKIW